MILSRLQMTVTLLIAILLHSGIAVWFSLPNTQAITRPKEKPPLQINLLATIAETSVDVTADVIKPPTPIVKKTEPVIKKTPVKPKPEPEPVKPQLPKVKPVTPPPAPEPVAKVVQQITQDLPEKLSPAPLDAVATARYEQLLVAWLQKYKKYPRRAKRLRIEGEGMLRILINRNGQTQKVSLEQGTGNRLLDKAALEMAQRANPFPAMPEDDPRQQLEFIVPVAFILR